MQAHGLQIALLCQLIPHQRAMPKPLLAADFRVVGVLGKEFCTAEIGPDYFKTLAKCRSTYESDPARARHSSMSR